MTQLNSAVAVTTAGYHCSGASISCPTPPRSSHAQPSARIMAAPSTSRRCAFAHGGGRHGATRLMACKAGGAGRRGPGRSARVFCTVELDDASDNDNATGAGGLRELPCLLFTPEEVFLPGSRKVLHLYEARFLALLDESMYRTGGVLAHIIFHPPGTTGSPDDSLQLERVATLCRMESVQRQEVGARVELVAEGRLQLCDVTRVSPYIKGVFKQVTTFSDEGQLYRPNLVELAQVDVLVTDIQNMLADVKALSLRMADRPTNAELTSYDESEDGLWQPWGHTEISDLQKSLDWVDGPVVSLSKLALPVSMAEVDWDSQVPGALAQDEQSTLEYAERLSFAILQLSPGSSEGEVHRLVQARTDAMALECGLLSRLETARDVLQDQVNSLRAKVAILSLGDIGSFDSDEEK